MLEDARGAQTRDPLGGCQSGNQRKFRHFLGSGWERAFLLNLTLGHQLGDWAGR
ncbi:MAG: hypothetical protein RLZ22_1108 [Verrucomicrobiota bacterium]|jgi:hypothetical protein